MKIVVPDDFPPVYGEHPEELDPLRAYGEVVLYSTRAASRAELLDRLAGAAVVINVRGYTKFDADLLRACPSLRLVSILGTGTDNVDLAAAAALGVTVTNTPGASTESVAELAFGLMLDAARHISLSDRRVRAGEWRHQLGMELKGKTLGVLGLGEIGQEMARRARGWGMRVIAWSLRHDPERAAACGAELVEFDDLFRQADVVSVHLRGSPRTAGLVGRRELALMKPTAVLVNTARGAIVDQDALVEALQTGRIAAAGLDVFPEEPLPPDSPLRTLDNVVLTPHFGWVTREANARLMRRPVENVIAFLEGRPQNVVNPA